MNIAEQLLAEMSRRNVDYIANYIGNDLKLFHELLELVWEGESPLPMRASWVVTAVTDKYPDLLHPYIGRIVESIEHFDHPGTRRNLLRYLASVEIPEALQGKLYDVCYRWALSRSEPPAIKAHSLQILYNIAKAEPDLKHELRLLLEDLANDESAAIKSKYRRLIVKL
jgi:hypothetical protein